MSEQHNKNGNFFFFILFSLSSFLSPLSSLITLFFFLSSLILPHSFLSTSPLFFFHSFFFSYCFSLFLLALPCHLLDLMSISIAVVFFFFFFSMIWWVCSVVGGFKWWWADRWWWVAMSRFSGGWVGLWVGCDGDGQIGGGGFWCTNSVVGGAACAWALMDGLAVGRLAAAVGGFVFFFFCFFFFFQ